MPRTKNITPKYELKVNCGDENLHTGTYCSLKEIASHLNFPIQPLPIYSKVVEYLLIVMLIVNTSLRLRLRILINT